MNRLALTGILSLGSLIPILHFSDPVMQAGLFWVALQLAIQVSFGFVPNALKVAAIACSIIVIIHLIWSRFRTTENFASASASASLSNTIAPQKCGGLTPDDDIEAPTPGNRLGKGPSGPSGPFGCAATSDCDVSGDCWSDPEKQLNRKIETQLRSSASLSKEIEEYLLVNEPDQRA